MKRDALLLAPAPRRTLPTLRQAWFQLHWFIGITAGTVLVVIGLTGALLAFRDELTDLVNPQVRHVPAQASAMVTPQQAVQAVRAAHPDRRVLAVIAYAAPGTALRVSLAPLPGEPRGETLHVHPYTGALQPHLAGDAAFEWIEYLHRWLLLPRDAGRPVAGTLALCLMGLALSGLYLRWPRRALSWRTWLTVDPRLKGRPFLWSLHAVGGTWALVAYLVFTASGAYWSFDVLRDTVDGWAGVKRPAREAAMPKKKAPASQRAPMDLTAAWTAFTAAAPGWQLASVRVTDKPNDPVQIAWLAADAPHPRARSRMNVALDGKVLKVEPYADQGVGARALTTLYPLHMGTYFGLPGRIAMLLASLALPGFAVTGWMLYLKRRRVARAARAERARFAPPAAAADVPPVLVVFASQTGQAEALALRTAGALGAAGIPADVRSAAALDPADLAHVDTVLFVASSHGEGEAPDAARRFARRLAHFPSALPHLRYAVLALGDRHYAQFCGFGHALDAALARHGARRLFPTVEVDNGDPAALARWSAALGCLGAGALDIGPAGTPAWQDFRLTARTLMNPGTAGDPMVEVVLTPPQALDWQPGDLLEILPPEGSADTAPRRYSIASIPADGAIELLVRQVRHARGMGLASGWLTARAEPGTAIRGRIVANPAFAPTPDDRPCLFIGNGSGLAGLRGHLRARIAAGRRNNWLVFGERQRAVDSLCSDELQRWAGGGFLPELDLVFSRDGDGYVQDRLRARAQTVRAWVDAGAVLYVCGSLDGMASGVDAALREILGGDAVDELAANGRLRRDVY